MFIFREGEFEIVKRDLKNVFYNSHTDTVAISEEGAPDRKTMVKSGFLVREQDKHIKSSQGQEYQYLGSSLHMEVMDRLGSVFYRSKPFELTHRTKYN